MTLFAASLYTGYRATAITAIRSLEADRIVAEALTEVRESATNRLLAHVVNQPDTRIVSEGVRDLLLEQRRRYFELAARVEGVTTFDPDVRHARTALARALLHDAHGLDHLADAPVPTGSPDIGRRFKEADRLLDEARRKWGLTPLAQQSDRPAPPVLHAGDDQLDRLRRVTDEPVDARLLILRDGDIRVLDLQHGTDTLVYDGEDGFWSATLGIGFVAVSEADGVAFIDLADPANPAKRRKWRGPSPGEALHVVPTADRHKVWIQQIETQPSGEIIEVDPTGVELRRLPSQGMLVHDLNGFAMAWQALPEAEDEDHRPRYRITGGGTELLCDCFLHGGTADRLLMSLGPFPPEVTDHTGRTISRLPQNSFELRAAALSPDGTKVAAGWLDGSLAIVEAGTGGVISLARTGGVNTVYWTPAGDRVFFSAGSSYGWYQPGDDAIHHLRLRRSGTELLGVF